jgi:hypothetical protein
MNNNTAVWCNALNVLKPATLKTLQMNLTSGGINLVDGWAASNPQQVQEWEKNGELLRRAQEAENEAATAKRQAEADGQTHLSDAEIYELYGGPSHRL